MNKHESMRGYFAYELFMKMKTAPNIWLLVGDLGYGVFDSHFKEYPERCINCGASEQAMLGIAVGLSQAGKIPFVYSITNFLLYRPYETIRNYVNEEKADVKLIASGRDQDYIHDGFSHWSEDARKMLKGFTNIKQYWPNTKEEIPETVTSMIADKGPSFISLSR